MFFLTRQVAGPTGILMHLFIICVCASGMYQCMCVFASVPVYVFMCEGMYVYTTACVFTSVCMYVPVYVCIYECMCMCVFASVCMYVRVYMCMYECMCVGTVVFVYVRVYVCMFECVCVCASVSGIKVFFSIFWINC